MPLPKKIPNEVKEIIIKANKEYPYLSFRKLAFQIYYEGYQKYTEDTLRQYVAFIMNEEIAKGNQDFKMEFGGMPETWYHEVETYEIPKKYKKLGIINDVHVPFHIPKVLDIALDYLQEQKIDMLLLNGDIADFYSGSHYVRNPKYRNMNKEVELVNQFLDEVQKKFDKVLYKFGNHEQRFDTFIAVKAPELDELDGVSVPELLNLSMRKIKYIEDLNPIKFNNLTILHGHEIKGGGTINIARNKLLQAFDNILFGHHHQHQNYVKTTITGGHKYAYSVACLSGLHPRFFPFGNWGYGFAIAERIGDDDFRVENKQIINNKII